MIEAEAETAAQETPDPRRFWWLKRLALLGLVGVVTLIGLRWYWEREANRRLGAIVADAQARGEPILPADFEPARIADGDNASILFSQAASALVTTPAFGKLETLGEDKPLTPAQSQLIASTLAANRQSLKLARQASTRPSASWNFPEYSQALRTWRSGQRDLGRLLYWAALYSHQQSDDREALFLANDLLRLSHAMDSGPALLINRIVAMVMEADAILIVHRVAREPAFGGSVLTPEFRQQIRDLIALFLEEDLYHHAEMRATFEQRARYLDNVGGIGQLMGQPADRVLTPMYKLDIARGAVRFGEFARATEASAWPAASARLPPDERFVGSNLFKVTRLVSAISMPRITDRLESFYMWAVKRRAAAIELSIRLYRFDHGSQYPRRLEDLVPDYLPAIPRDAMAADNRPLGYRPGARPPVIYSVGANGMNNGGSGASLSPEGRLNPFNVVFPLENSPGPTTMGISRQADDHQGDHLDRGNQRPAQPEEHQR